MGLNRRERILLGYVLGLMGLITIGFLFQEDSYPKYSKSNPVNRTTTTDTLVRKDTKKVVKKRSSNKVRERRMVTIDGFDPATNSIIDPLNLWGNYQTRTIVGRVHHGDKVYFIEREGNGIHIETKSGLKGWITYFFIDEFN